MPGSRSERASRTSRKASVRWFVVRAREQGPSNERPDPYRSYLYKVAEKESKSMDINELSLMDVVHLNDTRKLTPGPDGLKLEALTSMEQQLRVLWDLSCRDRAKVERPFRWDIDI